MSIVEFKEMENLISKYIHVLTLLRLYSTSPYYNNAHNFVFETELQQSKDFDEGSDLD